MNENIKYTLKPNKKQIKIMKQHWQGLCLLRENYHQEVEKIEQSMRKQTGIEDLEFFETDQGYQGIGNASRTMKLIQSLN